MKNESVLLVVLIAVTTQLGSALVLIATDHTLAGIIVALGTFLTGVGGALARSLVTPVANPKDNAGNALTPASRPSK